MAAEGWDERGDVLFSEEGSLSQPPFSPSPFLLPVYHGGTHRRPSLGWGPLPRSHSSEAAAPRGTSQKMQDGSGPIAAGRHRSHQVVRSPHGTDSTPSAHLALSPENQSFSLICGQGNRSSENVSDLSTAAQFWRDPVGLESRQVRHLRVMLRSLKQPEKKPGP